MKHTVADLSLFGGKALFEHILPVGQICIPEWARFEKMASGIFSRAYYSNHGVLAQQLEDKLCDFFGTKNATTVTNATIGLTIACKALDLPPGGKIIVPAFTFCATVQALTWAGFEPVFCDVDPHTHGITTQTVRPLLEQHDICAILGVHLWGNVCDVEGLESLAAEHGIPCFYDAAHAVGCTYKGKPVGSNGSCEVFSFHATKILSATEGGVITTNDPAVAERLRNLRSSYGRHANVPIPVNANGRFSEMQAAFALLSLENFSDNCIHTCENLETYFKELENVPGIRFLKPAPKEKHNYQYVVLEINEDEFGLSRDALVKLLEAENIHARRYFVPGMHRCAPYSDLYPQYVNALPVTDDLCGKVMQLPSGQLVTKEHVAQICAFIQFIHCNADALKGRI